MPDTHSYGPLADVVTYAGYVAAAAGALILSFKGRARWEPAEEDIPKGPQRLAALAVGVFVVLLWVNFRQNRAARSLQAVMIGLLVAAILAGFLYWYLISTRTFERIVVRDGKEESVKVIGGLVLTPAAKKELQKRPDISVQRLFRGSKYDVDRVWTRSSRSVAKLLFLAAYLVLTVSGTLALATAAMILSGQAGTSQ